MQKLIKKKLILLFNLTILNLFQNDVILAKDKSVYLQVESETNSSVFKGNKLKTSNFLYSEKSGYVDLYLYPYKSVRVQIFNCTFFQVENLSRVSDGINLNVIYKNIPFCPYKSSIKITSTVKSKNTKVKGKFKNRQVNLYGTELYISESLDSDEILIGVNKGIVQVKYNNESVNIFENYFIKSKNYLGFSDLIKPPLPILESVKKVNNLNRVCTHKYNTLISMLGIFPKLINDKKCIDTTLNDRMLVISPTGKGSNQLWKFY
jgi:hypothetical protein